MHRLHAALVAPLAEAVEPGAIVESGAGAGRLTRRLLDVPAVADAILHAIDPRPELDPQLLEENPERLVLHAERAISALGRIGAVDLALLDGDPNWYSVHAELSALIGAAERAGRPAPLAIVHNVHWPFGRRDGYHDPTAIPEAHRHAHSDLGLVPGRRDPSADGLVLAPHCAATDFEPRSGVLTAVEDFVAGSGLEWTVVEVPGFQGCAVLVEKRRLDAQPAVGKLLGSLRGSRFLATQARRAEAARLEAELRLARGEAPPRPEVAVEAPDPGQPDLEPVAVPEPERAPEAAAGRLEAIRELEAERLTLTADLAEQRARREALEWRLGRLEEDLGARDAQIGDLAEARERERNRAEEAEKGLVEIRVRLEDATARLEVEGATSVGLRDRVEGLEAEAAARNRELHNAIEGEKLALGRLSHREDALQAATAEAADLRTEVSHLQAELVAGRALLDEIGERVEQAAATRWARFGRRAKRIGRALTLRGGGGPADPHELARAAAERGLPSAEPRAAAADVSSEFAPLPEANLEERK